WRPPVRKLVQICQTRVLLFFPWKHRGDFLQPLLSLVVQRILQKNLCLDDQVLKRLLMLHFLSSGALSHGVARRDALRAARRRSSAGTLPRQPATDAPQQAVIDMPAQLLDPFLIPVVVGI